MLFFLRTFLAFSVCFASASAIAQCNVSDAEEQNLSKIRGRLGQMVATSPQAFAGLVVKIAIEFESELTQEEIITKIYPFAQVLPGAKFPAANRYPTKVIPAELPICAIPRLVVIPELKGIELNHDYAQHPSLRVGN